MKKKTTHVTDIRMSAPLTHRWMHVGTGYN